MGEVMDTVVLEGILLAEALAIPTIIMGEAFIDPEATCTTIDISLTTLITATIAHVELAQLTEMFSMRSATSTKHQHC